MAHTRGHPLGLGRRQADWLFRRVPLAAMSGVGWDGRKVQSLQGGAAMMPRVFVLCCLRTGRSWWWISNGGWERKGGRGRVVGMSPSSRCVVCKDD